jgi:hypothetical protein
MLGSQPVTPLELFERDVEVSVYSPEQVALLAMLDETTPPALDIDYTKENVRILSVYRTININGTSIRVSLNLPTFYLIASHLLTSRLFLITYLPRTSKILTSHLAPLHLINSHLLTSPHLTTPHSHTLTSHLLSLPHTSSFQLTSPHTS